MSSNTFLDLRVGIILAPISPLPFVYLLVKLLIYPSISLLPLPERIKDGFQKDMHQDKLNCPYGFITCHRHASTYY